MRRGRVVLITLIPTWLMAHSCGAHKYTVDYGSTACLSWAIGGNTSRFVHTYLSNDIDGATLTLSWTYLLQEANTLKAFLNKQVRCLTVFVSQVENLLLAIQVSKSVEDHLIVFSGKVKPPENLLKVDQRPILLLLA